MTKRLLPLALLIFFFSPSAISMNPQKLKVVECGGFQEASDVTKIEAFYSILTHDIWLIEITDNEGLIDSRENNSGWEWAVEDSFFIIRDQSANAANEFTLSVDGTAIQTGQPTQDLDSSLNYKGQEYENFKCSIDFGGQF